MNETDKLLVFTLSGQRCALSLSNVERIIRAVYIDPLPKAPEIVMGLIDVQGRAIAVLNIRKLFRLPEANISLNDQMIIARTSSRPVAILVDNTLGVVEYNEEDFTTSDALFPGIDCLEGVVKLKARLSEKSETSSRENDSIAYICNLDRFLSLEDKSTLDRLVPSGAKMSEIGTPGMEVS